MVGMMYTQTVQDIRGVRADVERTIEGFRKELLAVATTYHAINAKLAEIEGSLRHLPSKWTVIITTLMATLAIAGVIWAK